MKMMIPFVDDLSVGDGLCLDLSIGLSVDLKMKEARLSYILHSKS